MNHTKTQVPRMAAAKANSARLHKVEPGMNSSASKIPSWAEEMVAPGGGRDKLVHTQLLHDEARHAHAHAGAQNGQQPGQAGDEEYLQLFQIAGKQARQVYVNDAYKQ